jgi:hypothetical protein
MGVAGRIGIFDDQHQFLGLRRQAAPRECGRAILADALAGVRDRNRLPGAEAAAAEFQQSGGRGNGRVMPGKALLSGPSSFQGRPSRRLSMI